MSDRPPLAEPMDQVFAPEGPVQQQQVALRPGDTMIQSVGAVITAQRVAVPRDLGRVMQNLKALARASGQRYIYSWKVNDRANKRQVEIEGLTIKAAMDIARCYGNCVLDVRAFDQGESVMFYARFVDIETGFSVTRAFQQRKSQSIGMKDAAREADIVFQIGQSKAIRNVVLNALPSLADYVQEEANHSLLAYVENNKDKALEYVRKTAGDNDIKIDRIEAVVGRKIAEWNVRDLTKVVTELRGVEEGLSSPADLYPTDEDAKAIAAEKQQQRDEGKKPAPTDDKPADNDGKAEKPKSKSGGKSTGKGKAAEKPKSKTEDPPAQQEMDVDGGGDGLDDAGEEADDDAGPAPESEPDDDGGDAGDEELDAAHGDDAGAEEEDDDGLGDDEDFE